MANTFLDGIWLFCLIVVLLGSMVLIGFGMHHEHQLAKQMATEFWYSLTYIYAGLFAICMWLFGVAIKKSL
jgi:uncharacterized membrane protein